MSTEAADVLGEVAGKADQLARERHGPAQQGIGGVEPGFAQAARADILPAHVPDRAGEGCSGVLGQPHGLAHVPRRASPPVADDGGGEAGARAAVAAVDVLDHLLAPLVLEVDVDVGGLAALARDEALEQEVDLGRVDGGDGEAVADGGVGGGPSPLAEDVLLPGEAHDVVHGEEVGRVAELGDEFELVHQRAADLGRDAAGIAPRHALPGQRLQVLLRRGAGGYRLVGILVGQLVEAEGAKAHDLQRAGDGLLVAAEEPRHLGPALEMALGVGGEAITGLYHGGALADRGQHVLQRPALARVVVDVVGGDQRRLVAFGQRCQPVEAAAIIAPVEHVGGEVEGPCVALTECGQRRRERLAIPLPSLLVQALRRQRDQHLALGVRHHVVPMQHAAALGRAPLAESEQAAEAAVGGAVAGIAEEREPAGEVEPGAGQKPQPSSLRCDVGAHRAGKGVAVGDADGGETQRRRAVHQLVGVGGAAQKAEVAHRLQLGICRGARLNHVARGTRLVSGIWGGRRSLLFTICSFASPVKPRVSPHRWDRCYQAWKTAPVGLCPRTRPVTGRTGINSLTAALDDAGALTNAL